MRQLPNCSMNRYSLTLLRWKCQLRLTALEGMTEIVSVNIKVCIGKWHELFYKEAFQLKS